MDYLSYGKKILYVLAAMLIGLMLSMELLDRHTPKEEAKQNVFSSVLPTWMKVGDLEPIDSDSQVREAEDDASSLPLTIPEVQRWLSSSDQGKANWILYTDSQLYGLDDKWRLLGKLDSLTLVATPLISGSGFRVHMKNRRLVHPVMADFIAFSQSCRRTDNRIFTLISEIQLDPDIGLVIVINRGRQLPVVLGKGDMQRKVDYLLAVLNQEKAQPYLSDAILLDIRVNGQVIVKQRAG